MTDQSTEKILGSQVILVADGNPSTRRLTRQILAHIGVRLAHECGDGFAAVEAISSYKPNAMILDWEMPGLSGSEIMKVIRQPDHFPLPNLPVIMLTDHASRARIAEAIRIGAHEILVRPISPLALRDRLVAVALHPRPMVRAGKFYIPQPRRRVDLSELI